MTRRELYHVPAIVCDAEKLSQVAIIQELGHFGIPVVALSNSSSAIGFASKYVAQRILCPVASYDPFYIDFLKSSVPRGVLFYSNDACTENISQNRDGLISAGFSLLISDIAVLRRVIEKNQLYRTARECGISVPECSLVGSADEVQQRVAEYGVPVILKATNLAGGVYRRIDDCKDVSVAFQEMRALLANPDHCHRSAHLMVQRWISQPGRKLWNFNACVKSGEILSFVTGERIRSDHYPDGRLGSILLFGKTEPNPRIHELNSRLLRHLQFDGLVETEWSEDPTRKDETFLYDFNPRPSGNIRWSFKSGVSLAVQYYQLALGLSTERLQMKTGVAYAKVFYRWSDPIEACVSRRFTFTQKLSILKDDLLAVLRCRRHAVDILDPRDLGPTWHATAELARLLLGRLRRRISRALYAVSSFPRLRPVQ
jgi:predicted ATP-grasp superfamily ATP-dependent carboligase